MKICSSSRLTVLSPVFILAFLLRPSGQRSFAVLHPNANWQRCSVWEEVSIIDRVRPMSHGFIQGKVSSSSWLIKKCDRVTSAAHKSPTYDVPFRLVIIHTCFTFLS